MKYTVTVGGRTLEVEIRGEVVVLDGRPVPAELHAVPGTPLRQLVLADGTVTFAMERTETGWTVQDRGEFREVGVEDERTRLLREMTGSGGSGTGDQVVKAPMPGLVLRVEVTPGSEVGAGTPLLVLEAMKMENEIKAAGPGVVRAVHVAPGQAVERGTRLVEIAAAEG